MSNDGRIQQLIDRLPQLDESEKRLRQESNTCAYPEMDSDGQVKLTVTDPARLAAIKGELAAISQERARIKSKLAQLKELLGDDLHVPGTEGTHTAIMRLTSQLAQHFIFKVMSENPNKYILPEQAIKDPRYTAKRDEIMPQIDSCKTRIAEAEAQQVEVDAILRGG